jgi:DNA-binding LacI/PurR family transcriptional regulator
MRETTPSPPSIGPRGAGIREVARLSGVSIATVSRVFNDAASVSPETRQRVLERAEALGYAPSSLGRNLVRGRSELLGLIVPNVSFPLYGEMIGGIEAVLGERGMSILLASSHDDAGSELTATQHLLRHAVDGGIVINSLLDTSPPAPRAMRWVQISPEHAGLPFRVELDNAEGGRLAALELLRVGRRQLAYLGAPGRESQERERGFAEALGRAGLTYRRAEGDYSERSGTWAADTLLEGEGGGTPDGIFVAGDLMAAGVLRALHRRGLQVPGDVAVVGFDDAVIASLLYPRLTSVRQPARTMGAAAAELSLRLIAGLHAESVTFAPELVRRESTGPP